MSLANLIKEYKNNTDTSVLGNGPAIRAKEPTKIPILVSNKWENDNNKMLSKTFFFKNIEGRNRFVTNVLEYEMSIGHHSLMTINDKTVHVAVTTRKIDVVTEIDKEYAKYLDIIFKDIAYTPIHEPEEY